MIKGKYPDLILSGFTLVELLVVVSIASLFAVMLAASEPLISEERQAALTIARTYDLLRAGYLYFESNDLEWPDGEELDEFLLDDGSDYNNAFGQPYVYDSDTARFVVYQLVPEKWSGYIINHLESTQSLTLSEALSTPLASRISGLDRLYGRGYTALESTIDLYGNLHFAFVRRQFQSSSILFGETGRGDPSAGATEAVVFQPNCGESTGLNPVIHYTVRGVCSFYPRYYEHSAVEEEFESSSAGTTLDSEYRYTTWGYQFPVQESERDGRMAWVISLYSYEKWYQVTESTTTDSEGVTETTYAFSEREGWSPSQELCGQGYSSRYDNEDLDKENDSGVENSDFFDEDHLLYVDAWVSCQ